jgi:ABC-type amino acid transport substrate-binding protein
MPLRCDSKEALMKPLSVPNRPIPGQLLWLLCLAVWLVEWMGKTHAQHDIAASTVAREKSASLTDAQKLWIEEKKVVTYTCDPDWPPFSIWPGPGDEATGLDLDLLNAVLARTGLRGIFRPAKTWSEALAMLERGEVDLITGMARSSERARRFRFSDVYFAFPVEIIARDDKPFLTTISALRGKRLAIAKGYVTAEAVRSEHPEIEVVLTKTSSEALRLVAQGGVDASIENVVAADFLIKREGLANLKIAGLTHHEFGLRLAMRENEIMLQEVMNAGISSLAPMEHDRILTNWVNPHIDRLARLMRFFPWVLGVGLLCLIGGVGLAWQNRALVCEVAKRRDAELQLAESIAQKKVLMGIAAHDLRNPLTTVLLATDVIEGECKTPTQMEKSALDSIRASVQRMRCLVDNVLDLDAIESGKLKLNLRPTDISNLMREVATWYNSDAARKNIEIVVNTPAGALLSAQYVRRGCGAANARQSFVQCREVYISGRQS